MIALTSFSDKEMVREALQAGAISYLLKNVSVDDLQRQSRPPTPDVLPGARSRPGTGPAAIDRTPAGR